MQAINYYEAALKSENQQFLRSDLAELYLKLRQFDRAERTLTAGLSHGDGRLICEEGMERRGEEGGRKERRKRGRGGERREREGGTKKEGWMNGRGGRESNEGRAKRER